MSFLDSYAASLANLGIENPSSREFVDRPDLRTIVAFFLGWTFIAALRYLVLAVLRHPISAHLLRAALRRPILVTAAERQRASDVEGNHIQHWLHNTFSGPSTQSDRPEGTRHLSVVLTTAFALGVLMNFLSLLDYQNSGQDVLCIVVIAWAGISVACAKLAGLLRITIDLSRLGTGRIEKLASWFVLALSFGATLAHVTISIGATRDVPQLATLSLCYRRHFLLTSLIMSLLNITLEMYFMGRLFFLLVPEFLQFHHKVEIMMDVRVARVASILLLDLLMLLPSALSINLAAEFIPFSLGTLLVLAAFNHHPTKPADTQGFEHSASRTSVITFPRNQDDDHSIASTSPDQAEKIKPASLSPPAAPKSVKRRPTQKSRDLRASHISYDSEAEARSVRGAVVSFAFRSQEIEPMPAVPYGVFQPKLVGSPIVVPRAAQLPPVPSTSLSESHAHASLVQKPLPVPKPALGSAKLPVPPKDARPDSPAASIYGSDVIRRPMPDGPPKSSTVRPGSSSTVSRITTHSHGYTGPDLRHYSMSTSTQSPVSEPRDYLEVSPPRPGLVRTLTFGGRSTASYGQTSRVPSRNSSAGIQVAQEPRVI